MFLPLLLCPTALAPASGDVQRKLAVDPAAGVDGLDEVIVYPVELVQIMREPMKGERGCA
jgi:hypothetical protein